MAPSGKNAGGQKMGNAAKRASSTELATASQDGNVRIFERATGKLVRKIEAGHGGLDARCVVYSLDGDRVVTAGDDNLVKEWDLTTGILMRTLAGHRAPVWSVSLSDDGETWATGACDHIVKVWGISRKAAELKYNLTGHTDNVLCVRFSPRGGMVLATAGDDRTVRLWDTAHGALIRVLEGHAGTVWGLAWSWADKACTTLASCSGDKTVIVWNTSGGTKRRTYKGHEDSVLSVCYSPDGAWLASGGADNAVRIWDAKSSSCYKLLKGHTFSVLSVSFDPSSSVVASSSGDKTVKLWDVSSGECSRSFSGQHAGSVYSVNFAPSDEDAAKNATSWLSMTSEEKSKLFWIVVKQLLIVLVVIFFWIFVQTPPQKVYPGFGEPNPSSGGGREL